MKMRELIEAKFTMKRGLAKGADLIVGLARSMRKSAGHLEDAADAFEKADDRARRLIIRDMGSDGTIGAIQADAKEALRIHAHMKKTMGI